MSRLDLERLHLQSLKKLSRVDNLQGYPPEQHTTMQEFHRFLFFTQIRQISAIIRPINNPHPLQQKFLNSYKREEEEEKFAYHTKQHNSRARTQANRDTCAERQQDQD